MDAVGSIMDQKPGLAQCGLASCEHDAAGFDDSVYAHSGSTGERWLRAGGEGIVRGRVAASADAKSKSFWRRERP